MRSQRSRSIKGVRTATEEDRITQQAVLLAAIDLHPTHVTVSELAREMAARPGDFNECDRIERAVHDLAGVGLLHRQDFRNRDDAIVAPTRALLVANEILFEEWDDETEEN